jgi:hypothetical protein
MSGTLRGGRISLAAALGAMFSYDGGKPLTCRAESSGSGPLGAS